jgi:hypothetical protein
MIASKVPKDNHPVAYEMVARIPLDNFQGSSKERLEAALKTLASK